MNDTRQAIEEALYAYPYWPFNTRPFVRLGTRIIEWLIKNRG